MKKVCNSMASGEKSGSPEPPPHQRESADHGIFFNITPKQRTCHQLHRKMVWFACGLPDDLGHRSELAPGSPGRKQPLASVPFEISCSNPDHAWSSTRHKRSPQASISTKGHCQSKAGHYWPIIARSAWHLGQKSPLRWQLQPRPPRQ
jgi:hypothetical protein